MADSSRIPDVARAPGSRPPVERRQGPRRGKKYRRFTHMSRPALVGVLLLMLFGGMSNSLTGCSTERLSITGVILGGGSPPVLTADAKAEFDRLERDFARITVDSPERALQLDHLSDAFRRVRADYVYEISDSALVDAALEGMQKLEVKNGGLPAREVAEAALDSMMASLDPHSAYLNPQEFKDSQIATTGEFGGLGIEINMEEGLIRVISPIEDTPAHRAGIQAGDYITHVDGNPIEGMTLREAVHHMRGKPGTDIDLTIKRGERAPFNLTITRDVVRVRPIKARLEGEIGVIRVTQFIHRTEDELEKAIQELRKQSKDGLKGLVIDLRNNPGGLLNESVAVADAFLEGGAIVSVRDRSGIRRNFDAHRGDLARGLPIVVLINSGSASASEIVAGALQDMHRATVFGSRSFGKGSVQTITPLEWDGAVRLTTALYYLPSGRSIQGGGIVPNINVVAEEAIPERHESDDPKALDAQAAQPGKAEAELPEKACPAPPVEKEDKLLGCALMFLSAGSQENFLALIANNRNL
jgi:carboxyl-terminal processing protease